MNLVHTKYWITTVLILFSISFGAAVLAQHPEDAYDKFLIYNGQTMALEQEKTELKMMLNIRVDRAENTLNYLKNELNSVKNELPKQQAESLDKLKTSLEIYKTSLEGKINLIDEQDGAEWLTFNKDIRTWCRKAENNLAASLKEIKTEYISTTK